MVVEGLLLPAEMPQQNLGVQCPQLHQDRSELHSSDLCVLVYVNFTFKKLVKYLVVLWWHGVWIQT